MRAPLPTTDALFAQEVEQKMSNLLAGFGAVQSFLDRTKHRTATQLAAAESSPGTSKFESDLPGWEDSNFNVTQARARAPPRVLPWRRRRIAACCRGAVDVRQVTTIPFGMRMSGRSSSVAMSTFSGRQFVCEIREVRLNDLA